MKNIIIIGGSSGIGLALAQTLKDCRVTSIARNPCPVAGTVSVKADVTKPNELARAFASIDTADALVYTAGVSLAAPLEKTEPEDYRTLIETNLVGAIEATRLAIPLLRKNGSGKIIYAASSGAIVPIAFDACYSASKSALVMLARALDSELVGTNVTATAAIIGGTRTRFTFKRKMYENVGEPYEKNLKAADDRLVKIEQNGYTAPAVAEGLIKILDSKNPPPVVTVGAKNKIAMCVYRAMPLCVKRMIYRTVFGIECCCRAD